MQQDSHAEALRRFCDADRAWANATQADLERESARLLASVFAELRVRYPDDADAIADCEGQGHPMSALWHHPLLGVRTRALMVEMGLLVPLPAHVAAALRMSDDPAAEEDGEGA